MAFALSIGFGIIIVIGVVALVTSFSKTILDDEVRRELNQLALQVSDAVVKLHDAAKSSKASPQNQSSILISKVDLNLPTRASGKNYEIDLIAANRLQTRVSNISVGATAVSIFNTELAGAKVVAKTRGESPEVSVEIDIPQIEVGVQGRAENGENSTLRYYRHNFNQTIYDTIVLGEFDLITRIDELR